MLAYTPHIKCGSVSARSIVEGFEKLKTRVLRFAIVSQSVRRNTEVRSWREGISCTESYLMWLTRSLLMVLQIDPAFQRFAVRTSKRIEDLSIKAAQTKRELTEQVKDLSRNFEILKNSDIYLAGNHRSTS
ncbi:unnamed protein product [Camellia sinensis]